MRESRTLTQAYYVARLKQILLAVCYFDASSVYVQRVYGAPIAQWRMFVVEIVAKPKVSEVALRNGLYVPRKTCSLSP